MRSPRLGRLFVLLPALFAPGAWLHADKQVAIVARASTDYVERRLLPDGQPRVETYVFLEGNRFRGPTVDRSIDRMSFRQIAEQLAPQLAKQHYLPALSAAQADLLLVVHWGTTRPHVSTLEMTGRTSPLTDQSSDNLIRSIMQENGDEVTSFLGGLDSLSDNQKSFDILEQTADQLSTEQVANDNASLLGYNDELHKLGKRSWTSESERALRQDLLSERYFIIIKAYDLKPRPEASRRPLWSAHVNIGSPGNNFQTALSRMGAIVSLYAGQHLAEVRTQRANVPTGQVTLAPMVILREEK